MIVTLPCTRKTELERLLTKRVIYNFKKSKVTGHCAVHSNLHDKSLENKKRYLISRMNFWSRVGELISEYSCDTLDVYQLACEHDQVTLYLVNLVSGAVLPDPYGDCGFIRQRYPQLNVWHAVVVLESKMHIESMSQTTDFNADLHANTYLICFRQKFLHDVTLADDPYRTHCRNKKQTGYLIIAQKKKTIESQADTTSYASACIWIKSTTSRPVECIGASKQQNTPDAKQCDVHNINASIFMFKHCRPS